MVMKVPTLGALLWLSNCVGVALAADENPHNLTRIHEAGRCAVRGQCGKEGFLGDEDPCPDNGLAGDLPDSAREKLVSFCGEEWNDTKVCCDSTLR